MISQPDYLDYMQVKETEHENKCSRCGKCCGLDNDPCSNLVSAGNGSHICKNYSGRLGSQVTASGKLFNCVEIRELVRMDALPIECSYRRE